MLTTTLLALAGRHPQCSRAFRPSRSSKTFAMSLQTRRRNRATGSGLGSRRAASASAAERMEASARLAELERQQDGDSDSDVINCVCGDDLYDGTLMIQCDRCFCWQHGICVGIRSQEACPDFYLCTECQDRADSTEVSELANTATRTGTRSRRMSGGNSNSAESNGKGAAVASANSNGASTQTSRSRRSREPEPAPKRSNSNGAGTTGRSRRQRSADDERSITRSSEPPPATASGSEESPRAGNGSTGRRKRKAGASEGEEGETSTDETGSGQTRPKKRVSADQLSDDSQSAGSTATPAVASARSQQNGRQSAGPGDSTHTAAETNGDASVSSSAATSVAATPVLGNAHFNASVTASPKRGRRGNRGSSTKSSDAHGSGHYNTPSYRPRVWTTRTSLDDLRRRARQIEGYVRRLQQDLDDSLRRERARSARFSPASSVASPTEPMLLASAFSSESTLTKSSPTVASPESMHEDGAPSTNNSRATSPSSSLPGVVDLQLLEGIESLLSTASADPVDTKLESFPYASLLEGVRRTAVAFLSRHTDD
ncbi:hypothetical protein THASP1DRAFT_29141 [Thamnocephalis sphaerospora]|uniref:Zinc finger PHD-type domain-containing protein n=1 Tax=Thamnocephalis sphaerospora TaxID=78915 RepID=A0A4P9XSG5_9FUNG|nr:hypothetical protein THASP1DRAFT_29141 [Thamnocephalis sphaerospora]|eukprot:RKP09058.1 hypothetical protein THASP1DRAFT_29141 [Thamnocephalis sphaerospora]